MIDKKNFKPASLQIATFIASACLFFFVNDAFARGKQTEFSKKQFTEKTQFDISYSNQAKQSYALTFLLNNHILRQAGIPKYNKLQRLIRDDTIASANLAAKKNRAVLDQKYQQAHNRIKNFTERANQELAPWYQIILTRTGRSDFGVRAVPNQSTAIEYFWQTPSLAINLQAATDIKPEIQKIVRTENQKLGKGASVSVKISGQNIRFQTKANSNEKQRQANEALYRIQAQTGAMIKAQKQSGQQGEIYFQKSRDLLGKELAKIEKIAGQQLTDYQASYRELQNQTFQKHYLRLVNYDAQDVVRIDYEKVVHDYIVPMKPIARAIARTTPENAAIRGYVETALHFVQTIPYDRLEQRDLKTLSGFLLPTEMIAQNRGDCDTKSTALAAILAHILTNQQVIMVIIPNHAFLGIEMRPEKNDQTYQHQGKNYVLLEVAGPATLKVG